MAAKQALVYGGCGALGRAVVDSLKAAEYSFVFSCLFQRKIILNQKIYSQSFLSGFECLKHCRLVCLLFLPFFFEIVVPTIFFF